MINDEGRKKQDPDAGLFSRIFKRSFNRVAKIKPEARPHHLPQPLDSPEGKNQSFSKVDLKFDKGKRMQNNFTMNSENTLITS